MGVLNFFSKQRPLVAVLIYALLCATWLMKWYLMGWGDSENVELTTPLCMIFADKIPDWVLFCLSLPLYILTAAVTQTIFSRVNPSQSKTYLMHLFVPLLSTMTFTGNIWGSLPSSIATLVSLYVVILLLTREENSHLNIVFRSAFAAGVTVLIYYPAVVLLLVVIVALILRNMLTGKGIFIALIGFSIPLGFAAGVALLLGVPVDSYIGVNELAKSIAEGGVLRGVSFNASLAIWGILLVLLIILALGGQSRHGRTILAVYKDNLFYWITFLSVATFVVLPMSSPVPVMVAPAAGSSFVYYFTGKGEMKVRKWLFLFVVGMLIVGNLLGR